MTEKSILFVKPFAISEQDKSALRDAGVIVVEMDNPAEARLTRAGHDISSSGMLSCALKALSKSGSVTREYFSSLIISEALAQSERKDSET